MTINHNTDWSSYGPITLVVENNAQIKWNGNYNFRLANGSGVILRSGGSFSTANPCNSNWLLQIGNNPVATCSGGNGVFSFAQLNAAGGTPTVWPEASNAFLCSPNSVSINGNPSGILSNLQIHYQWTGSGPGSFAFSSPNSYNTQVTGINTPGLYTFTLNLTATQGSKSYTYNASTTTTLYVPPINQSISLSSPTTCRGSSNKIKLSASQVGVTYTLYNHATNTILQTLSGKGSAIEFPINFNSQTITYSVRANYPNNPCITNIGSTITVTPAIEPKFLTNNLDECGCFVEGNQWVDFTKNDRLAISIHSNGQTLGDVSVITYVDPLPIDVEACQSTNALHTTSVLGRRFAIKPEFQPTQPVKIRLYFSQNELDLLIPAANANVNPNDDFIDQNISELVLSKYSNTINPTVINGTFTDNCINGAQSLMFIQNNHGVPNAIWPLFSDNTGKYVEFTIPSFSEFWLHGNVSSHTSPLPVEMTETKVICSNSGTTIEWETASEVNNELFIIERSTNLDTWEKIEEIPGAGQSNQPMFYSYTDHRNLSGISYYRISQKDFDGTLKTYAPLSSFCENKNEIRIQVFPNPADEFIQIDFNTLDINDSEMMLEIINVQGIKVRSEQITIKEKSNRFTLNRGNLATGIYFLKIKHPTLEIKPVKVIFQ